MEGETLKNYSIIHTKEGEVEECLNNLSKINIFIGENNSGKSRCLRELFIKKTLVYKDSRSKIIGEHVTSFIDDMNHLFKNKKNIQDSFLIELKKNFKRRNFFINGSVEIKKLLTEIAIEFVGIEDISPFTYSEEDRINIGKVLEKRDIEIGNFLFSENSAIKFKPNNRIYIPILRGLRTYDVGNSSDIYFERTKKDYFLNMEENIYERIFTGLSLYDICKNLNNDLKPERNKLRSFEKFLSDCFFDGKEINLTANRNDSVVYISIDEEERPVSQLGDGIQSVIILTYPLFFNQGENMLFFFEEPEQCLHPAYQRIFMETLMREEFDTFQYFFTTHSNHLLDITLDIEQVSIYTFKKTNDSQEEPTFEIENVDNENTDILRLIGVRNSSVFLSNCTIWVEGITDRIYIRKYLEMFQKTQDKNFLEDIHYSFVEYGGGNITHWSFLEDADPKHSNILVDRLCGKLFLITDKDGAGQKKDGTEDKGSIEKKAKYDRHIKLKEKLGDKHYHCLEAREIENLLSTEVMKEVVKVYEKSNADTIIFTDKFDYENYKTELLGKFIDKYTENRKRKSYAADSGTINDKVQFAKRAVEEVKSINDLSEEAKELTKKLYEFIKEQNGDKDSVKNVSTK